MVISHERISVIFVSSALVSLGCSGQGSFGEKVKSQYLNIAYVAILKEKKIC